MIISGDEVKYVAALARLKIAEDELEQWGKQLGEVIEFADKLNEINTADTLSYRCGCETINVFREDEVADSTEREKILSNAPVQTDGCYVVPRVVE